MDNTIFPPFITSNIFLIVPHPCIRTYPIPLRLFVAMPFKGYYFRGLSYLSKNAFKPMLNYPNRMRLWRLVNFDFGYYEDVIMYSSNHRLFLMDIDPRTVLIVSSHLLFRRVVRSYTSLSYAYIELLTQVHPY